MIQIGSTTCGKPYGFYPADHCGTTYFSVQFKGVNAQAFGDYTDGLYTEQLAGRRWHTWVGVVPSRTISALPSA